jgi:hypothetical protein
MVEGQQKRGYHPPSHGTTRRLDSALSTNHKIRVGYDRRLEIDASMRARRKGFFPPSAAAADAGADACLPRIAWPPTLSCLWDKMGRGCGPIIWCGLV